MRHARWAVSSMILAAVLAASTARAQDLRRFHVTPYAGIFVFDDEQLTAVTGDEVDLAPILGARIGFAITRSWQIEGGYGYAPLSTEPSQFQEGGPSEDGVADLKAHVLYGAIDYLLAYAENPTKLLLTAGWGVLIVEPEGGGDSTNDPVLELGAGFTHPVRDWITFRGEARDHMTFCEAPSTAGESSACLAGDDTLHNFEVSAGLQFWLF